MSNLRKHFRVAWDDGPLVDIVTNARDMAAAGEYADNPVIGTFALLHAALMRYGHNVPPDLDKFVDVLDDMQTDETADEPVNPTEPTAYTPAPLP